MQKLNDLSRSPSPLDPDGTLIAVIELSLSSWLVAGIVPGVERQPLKKLAVDESALLKLLHRWREEAAKAGRRIKRITVAFEAGRDGFWLARWLGARDIEAHVIHASSVAVSREHRRAKTDRLDTELLKRSFLGWLRGERDHCKMVAIPTTKDEDAKRPNREHESLVGEQSRIVNRMKATLIRLGIRGFNPKLKKAAERLDGLRTPEGEPIPPNTLAELRRDMVRRRLVSDQIKQIEDAIGGLFPGASRGNYQPRAMGATINSERGRGVLRRRACRHERSDLRPIVRPRGRLADDPVWPLRPRGIRCFSHLLQKRVDALRPLNGFKLRACLQAINGVVCLSTHGLAQAREHGRNECAQTLYCDGPADYCDGPADRVCG